MSSKSSSRSSLTSSAKLRIILGFCKEDIQLFTKIHKLLQKCLEQNSKTNSWSLHPTLNHKEKREKKNSVAYNTHDNNNNKTNSQGQNSLQSDWQSEVTHSLLESTAAAGEDDVTTVTFFVPLLTQASAGDETLNDWLSMSYIAATSPACSASRCIHICPISFTRFSQIKDVLRPGAKMILMEINWKVIEIRKDSPPAASAEDFHKTYRRYKTVWREELAEFVHSLQKMCGDSAAEAAAAFGETETSSSSQRNMSVVGQTSDQPFWASNFEASTDSVQSGLVDWPQFERVFRALFTAHMMEHFTQTQIDWMINTVLHDDILRGRDPIRKADLERFVCEENALASRSSTSSSSSPEKSNCLNLPTAALPGQIEQQSLLDKYSNRQVFRVVLDYVKGRLAMEQVFDMLSTVRLSVIRNMGRFKTDWMLTRLLHMLENSTDPNIVAVAALALGKTGERSGVTRESHDDATKKIENIAGIMLAFLQREFPNGKCQDRLVRESVIIALGKLQQYEQSQNSQANPEIECDEENDNQPTTIVDQLIWFWRNDPISNVRDAAQSALKCCQLTDRRVEESRQILEKINSEISTLRNL